MTWTRLSDDFLDREQMLLLDRDARLLHVEALVWANRAGTDGRVPRGALRKLTDLEEPTEAIAALVDAGLWEETDTGWQVEWQDQELHADVQVRQERAKERQRRHRLHLNGEHNLCNPKYCKETRHVTRHVTRDTTGYETPTHPIPSRPGPKEPGRGRVPRAADKRPSLCPNGAIVAADGECCEDCATSVRVEAS